jgi:TolB-like protein/tetratricopeptide (TPR) repeat protein
MSDGIPDVRLEIAHVLFMDIVGWSKLLINEQSELLGQLNEIVRNTTQVRAAEAAGKLIRLPTGDGMALAFFTTPDAPVRCAIEIGLELKNYPRIALRMGVHSGPVEEVVDVNERANIAGAGITVAQRVMDCGNAGHILLSKRAADDLAHYGQWRPYLHELGQSEIKHGFKLGVVNFYTDEVGNPATPEKFGQQHTGWTAVRESLPTWRPRTFLMGSAVLLAAAVALALWALLARIPPRPNRQIATATTTTKSTPFGKRLAVLPFKPLVAEDQDQVLELGMADSLITKLSNTREVIVSSLPAVRKFGGLDQDPVAAGRQLQVNSVLDGNVQRSGDHIRVTARLINVSDGSSIWAGTFDEKFTDVFTVQDTISRKVTDALAVRLSGEEEQRLTRRYTDDVGAYQLYMTGRYLWTKLTPPDIKKAIDSFNEAIEKDPAYALAYFGLAESLRSLAINADVPSKDCLPAAKMAATKALEIDPSLAEAHASLSFSLVWYEWDWINAEKEARQAIALNPNSAHGHFACAAVLSDLGQHDEAIAQISQARELDPVFPLYAALEGMFLLHAGRDAEAATKLRKVEEIEPNFWVTRLILGRVYLQQRKYPEAIAEFEKARDLSHGNSEAIASIGYTAAVSGDATRARAILEELNARSLHDYVPPHNIALVYNGLGDQEAALTHLEKGCDDRDVRMTLLGVDPRWDSLRSQPRFRAILKRIGLHPGGD